MPKPNRKNLRRNAAPLSRRRQLRVDVLEDRRMFAGLELGGLEVLVFEDSTSLRQVPTHPVPAAERVVYLDLNRDGFFQANEPAGITDLSGRARFDNLVPGSYSVQLLSNQRSVIQTTSNAPASSGAWTFGMGVQQVLRWESESTAWFATKDAVQKWNVETGELGSSIDLQGEFVSGSVSNRNQGFALVRRGDSNVLVALDLNTAAIQTVSVSMEGMESLLDVGDATWVRAQSNNGSGLYRIRFERELASAAPSIDRGPDLEFFSPESTVQAFGTERLIVVDSLKDGSRVSTYQLESTGWQLAAERLFEESIRFSSALNNGTKFAVETSSGVMILNNTFGLPTIEVLEMSQGPTQFDSTRGIFISHDKTDPSQIVGWSSGDWSKVFAVPFTNGNASAETLWSLGYLNDALIGIQNGAVYRHALNGPSGTEAAIGEGTLQQIAIGIRSRGMNRPPVLRALPSFSTNEDEPVAIPRDALAAATSDSEGDTVYHFVRSPGTLGRLQWSSNAFGVYVPTPDANGRDLLIIQAYDGSDWSAPQSLAIQIRPVNDLPSGFDAPTEASIAERDPGADVASVRVRDVDQDAEYRYVVSDGRFAVVNGMLKLQPGVALDFEATPILVLSVTATEVNHRDIVTHTITLHVQDRNDPPLGIVLTGNGSVPENRSGYVVGNVNVIDPDRSEVYDIAVSDPRFEVAGNVVRVKPGTKIEYKEPGWIELTFSAVSRSTGDSIQRTDRIRVIKDETPNHNDSNPADVDGDGKVTPLDALIIINYINSHGSGPMTGGEGEAGGDLDVDGDGRVSPLDILIVINAINASRHERDGKDGSSNQNGGQPPEGEGEGNGNSHPLLIGAMVAEEELPLRRRRK